MGPHHHHLLWGEHGGGHPGWSWLLVPTIPAALVVLVPPLPC